MGNNENFGFGKFVPGFDFLQNLAKGASQALPQMPNLSNWIAPTLNPEELEKRIGELKAVHFWLDQNSKALSATIQALELQKMTLATLKGMNFNMGDVANAFKVKAPDSFFGAGQQAGAGQGDGDKAAETVSEEPAVSRKRKGTPKTGKAGATASGVVDPLQWWSALTQQFQQIAATALKDVAAQTSADATRQAAAASDGETGKTPGAAVKPATGAVRKRSAKRPARKTAARR